MHPPFLRSTTTSGGIEYILVESAHYGLTLFQLKDVMSFTDSTIVTFLDYSDQDKEASYGSQDAQFVQKEITLVLLAVFLHYKILVQQMMMCGDSNDAFAE
jgi:hypothetical protein